MTTQTITLPMIPVAKIPTKKTVTFGENVEANVINFELGRRTWTDFESGRRSMTTRKLFLEKFISNSTAAVNL